MTKALLSSMPRVKVPHSGGRRGHTHYAKLIKTVELGASAAGFSFRGKLLRPGSEVAESELRPGPDWPAEPLVLECFSQGDGWGNRRSTHTYILWVYREGRWHELGRANAVGAEWIAFLEPAVSRAVHATRWPFSPEELAARARRIRQALDSELAGLNQEQSTEVLNLVYNELATRICGGWKRAA